MLAATFPYAILLALTPNLSKLPIPAPAEQVATADVISLIPGLEAATYPGSKLAKWNDVISRQTQQLSAQREKWERIVHSVRQVPPEQLLDWVNKEVNRGRYVSDSRNWNDPDFWATPMEFMERGGDCEDYAITKYFLLAEAGLRPERMEIAITKDHAVLIVATRQGPVVLDNRRSKPYPLKKSMVKGIIYTVNGRTWSVRLG